MRAHRAGIVTLSAVMAIWVTAAHAADDSTAAEATTKTASAGDAAAATDYYTRRAESLIAAEKKAETTKHPLAEAYPGFSVVVCEAGCPGHKDPQIVFARPAAQAAEATQGEMLTTSDSGAPAPAGESNLACVAGCYGSSSTPEMELPGKPHAKALPATVSAEHANPSPARPASPLRDKLSPIR